MINLMGSPALLNSNVPPLSSPSMSATLAILDRMSASIREG